ncbi:YkgJ family cysteine cluster protein [Pelagicoccus sp. SDUM812002]|uniref:YkgJ family cysteine cluster protein n=1 Tax=Pelagicoccus sp. SDUM812002 TaxID=3041266 RepID=UPI0034E20732
MCTKCGGCCSNFPFVELSEGDIERLKAFTGWKAEIFSDSDQGSVSRRFLRFQEDGSCVFLEKDSGVATCNVYEARPEICRTYPFTPSQDRVCEATWRSSIAALAGKLGG